MDDVSQHRSTRQALPRAAVPLLLAVCLLASCGSPGAGRAGTTDRSVASRSAAAGAVRSPRTRGTDRLLAAVPAARDPSGLARELDRAAATLRNRRAPVAGARRAGEFQQLAVGTLAAAPGPFRSTVMARLSPATAMVVGGDVRAARALQALTAPQRRLPRWRIVAPRPPAVLLGYYRDAQRRTGVPWTYLAAINFVETRMGRIRGASPAGARGPMQFIPSTWDRYGAGGDIDDPHDAILAAARLLKDNGAPGDMAGALRHFNPSADYVRAVTDYARTMRQSGAAYRGYWYWRVLYRHTRGTYVLPVGYPHVRPVLLPASQRTR